MSTKRLIAVATVALVALAAVPAHAQTNTPNSVRVTAGYMSSTSDIRLESDTNNPSNSLITSNNEWKNGWGIGASYEYRMSPMLGVEAGLRYFRPNVRFSVPTLYTREDRVSLMPATVGLNVHFGAPDKVDFYFGPQLAYVWYGSFDVPVISFDPITGVPTTGATSKIDFKNEFTWGGRAGLDFALSPNMGITVNADYIAAEAKVDNDPNAAVFGIANYKTRPRPLFINAGLVFHF